MPQIAANGIQVHYETSGQGQPLVFIHGLGSSGRDWEAQVAAFAPTYQVITVDLRGHGQSEKPPGPYTVPMFAADVAGVLQGLGIGAAHIVGVSLGGGVAFQLAIDYPALVKTLTIVNSGPALGGTPDEARQEIERRVGIVQMAGMRAIGENLAPNLFPDSPELRQLFIERWTENDAAAYVEATRSMLGWNVIPQLGTITCPTLVISADQDYAPVAAKEFYVKLMPKAELVVIPNSHHALPMEAPAAFNAALAAFLDQHP